MKNFSINFANSVFAQWGENEQEYACEYASFEEAAEALRKCYHDELAELDSDPDDQVSISFQEGDSYCIKVVTPSGSEYESSAVICCEE